ncbi:putative membrane protein [Frigoribacterium sp. UYMn621]
MNRRWMRLSRLQWVLLVALVICLLGALGSLIWNYPIWPFSLVGSALIILNFVMSTRAGLSAPVDGRPDLDKRYR